MRASVLRASVFHATVFHATVFHASGLIETELRFQKPKNKGPTQIRCRFGEGFGLGLFQTLEKYKIWGQSTSRAGISSVLSPAGRPCFSLFQKRLEFDDA